MSTTFSWIELKLTGKGRGPETKCNVGESKEKEPRKPMGFKMPIQGSHYKNHEVTW